MLLLKLALLNIGRNIRRSIITVLAVGVGLGAMIFLWGFSDGTSEQMRSNVINLFTGHVQIHAKDFEKTLSPELLIPDQDHVIEKVNAQDSVTGISERIKCEALVGTSERSRGVLLIGMDPDKERQVTNLQDHMRSGTFLTAEGEKEILLGSRLAERLQVELDDKVVVMTQAIDGTLAGYAYRLKGIFHTGSQQVDELTAYISLDSARELLDVGDGTHEIVIKLADRDAITPFISNLEKSLNNPEYEIEAWDVIVPEPNMWVKWNQSIMDVIMLAVMVIIGVGIMNTVLMSVYERTRELGVMMAIGTKPSQMIALIFLETTILQIFGIILGLIGGYAVVAYFGQVGISFKELEQALSQSYVSSTTYTQVAFHHVVQSIVTLMALTSCICLYPAWKVGRMEPVKAIYHS